MPSPSVPPDSGHRIQVEKGRENFSPAESKVLREYLDDFRSKNKEERKQLLMFKIYRLIKAVGPELDGDQWRARKRKVKEWYYNHGRRPQVRRFGYVKQISLKYVIAHVKQDELYTKIGELSEGAPPGSRVFLSKYQQGLKFLLDNLSASERSEYQALASQWTNESPPPDVQTKLWGRVGYKMVQEMEKVKSYQLGLISWGLLTHYDSKGDCHWMFIDHNQEFGPAGTPTFQSMFPNEVKNICEAWATYSEHIQGLKAGVCGDVNKYTSRKKKKMKFQMDGHFPLLPYAPPAATQEKAEVLQVMIREFIGIHYQLACGKESSMTPWGAMAKHQSMIWDADVWPSGVTVQDPSKIVLGDCQKIVTLWRERQAQGGASYTFKFNFYLHSEGLRPAIYSLPAPAVLPQGALTSLLILPQSPIVVSSPHIADSSLPACSTEHQIPPTLLQEAVRDHNILLVEEHRRRTHIRTPPDTSEVNLHTGRHSIDEALGSGGEIYLPEEPESDPPVEKGKQKKKDKALSTGEESSDVTTDPDGRKSRRSKQLRLQRSLVNMSPEPVYDNDDSLPPRLGKKSRSKVARKANTRRPAPPPLGQGNDDTGGDLLDDTAGGDNDDRLILRQSSAIGPRQVEQLNADNRPNAGRVDAELQVEHREEILHVPAAGGGEPSVRNRIKPKPKPLKKPATSIPIDDETQEEQRVREDNLFIVRKSGRTHKPKYNIAPPAQLRLEREREASRNRK